VPFSLIEHGATAEIEMDTETFTDLDKARRHLANSMLNQVGVEWDECCDSVEIIEGRLRGEGFSDRAIADRLYDESHRYDDM
jgi:hypothetical protein